MTEQERNVLLNELRQQESQREKQIKRERFRRLNPYACLLYTSDAADDSLV